MQGSTPADNLPNSTAAADLALRSGGSDPRAGGHAPSSQTSASQQDTFDARTTYCLLARDGRIIASDGVLDAWRSTGCERGAAKSPARLSEIVTLDHAAGFFAQALDETARVDLTGTIDDAGAASIAVQVELRRLAGAAEPLVLAAITRVVADGGADPRDALTQLPDRTAIARRAAAWRRAAPDAAFAVLFLDLDDFKAINDRHGHAVGDAVLATLAARWQQCVREGDLVARYGGDEFVVLVRNAVAAEDVEPVIHRLRDATQASVVLGDASLHVQATIGWAAAVDPAAPIESLVAAADSDMYSRKRRVLR